MSITFISQVKEATVPGPFPTRVCARIRVTTKLRLLELKDVLKAHTEYVTVDQDSWPVVQPTVCEDLTQQRGTSA